jgi:hypothetical protein
MLLFTLIAILNTSLDGPGEPVGVPGFDVSPGEKVRQIVNTPPQGDGNVCSEPGVYPQTPPVDPSIFEPIPFPLRQPTIEDIITAEPAGPGIEIPYISMMAIERKQALKIMAGLSIQVELHLRKIANEPNSQAVEHWRSEVNNWINAIERLSAQVGKKTQAEWAEVIENWRSRLGD